MATNEIELKDEIAKIKSTRFSVKGYFDDLFKQLLPSDVLTNQQIIPVNKLINEETLPDLLNDGNFKCNYVLLFYAHKTHTNYISPFNGDKNAAHTSILLGKIADGKISQLLNIDGYHRLGYIDILGERSGGTPNKYIKNRLVIDVQDDVNSNRRPLQNASWENLNCPLYAFAFAKAILNIFEFSPNIIDDLFPDNESVPSRAALDNLKYSILKNLAGIYVKQGVECEFYRDRDACRAFHNEIRDQLAETITARYHLVMSKSTLVKDSAEGSFENNKNEGLIIKLPSVVPVSMFQQQPSIVELNALCNNYKAHLFDEMKKLTNCDPEILVQNYKDKCDDNAVVSEMDILINKYKIVARMLYALNDSLESNEFNRIQNMKNILTPEAKESLSVHRGYGAKFLQAILDVLGTLLRQNWKYKAQGELFCDDVEKTYAMPSSNM